MSQERDIYVKFAALRTEQHARYGAIAPVDRKPRWVIPNTTWRASPVLVRALKAISPKFEIIYDPLTRDRNKPPEFGCHLYTIERAFVTGLGNQDMLVLETSLQFDTSMPWPSGQPRPPGMWLIQWIRDHDKANRIGDESHVNSDVCQARMNGNIEHQEALARADNRLAEDIYKEWIDPYYNRARRLGVSGRLCPVRTSD